MKRGEWLLFLAWIVSLFGFCLSLFYGEILQHVPCALCWYQRISLFPLVFLLGAALYRKEWVVVSYCIPLALFGFSTALFQVVKNHVPFFKTSPCSLGTPCTDSAFILGGLVSFPLVSALGFAFLTLLLTWIHFCYTEKSIRS